MSLEVPVQAVERLGAGDTGRGPEPARPAATSQSGAVEFVPYSRSEIQVEKHGGKRTLQVFCRPVIPCRQEVEIELRPCNNLLNPTTNTTNLTSKSPRPGVPPPSPPVVANIVHLLTSNSALPKVCDVRYTAFMAELHGDKRGRKPPTTKTSNRPQERLPTTILTSASSQKKLVKNLIRTRNLLLQDNLDLVEEIAYIRNKFYEFYNDKMPKVLVLDESEGGGEVANQCHEIFAQNKEGITEGGEVKILEEGDSNYEPTAESASCVIPTLPQVASAAVVTPTPAQVGVVAGVAPSLPQAVATEEVIRQMRKELTVAASELARMGKEREKLERVVDELREEGAATARSLQVAKLELEISSSSKETAVIDLALARSELETTVKARDWYQEEMKGYKERCTAIIRELVECKEENISLKSHAEETSLKLRRSEEALREGKASQLREKENLIKKLELLEQALPEKGETPKDAEPHNQQEIQSLVEKLALKENMLENKDERIKKLEHEQTTLTSLCQEFSTTLLEREAVILDLSQTAKEFGEYKRNDDYFMQKFDMVRAKDELALSKLQEEKDKLQDTLETVRKELSETGDKFSQLSGEIVAKDKEISILTEKLAFATHKLGQLDEAVEKDSQEKADLEAEISQLKRSLEKMEYERKHRETENQQLTEQLEALGQQLKEQIEGDKQQLTEQLEILKQQLTEKVESDKRQLEVERGQLTEQLEAERGQLTKQLEVEREKLIEQLEVDQLRLEEEMEAKLNLEKLVRGQATEIETLKSRQVDFSEEKVRSEEHHTKLLEQLEILRAEKEVVSEEKEGLRVKYLKVLEEYEVEKGEMEAVIKELDRVQTSLCETSSVPASPSASIKVRELESRIREFSRELVGIRNLKCEMQSKSSLLQEKDNIISALTATVDQVRTSLATSEAARDSAEAQLASVQAQLAAHEESAAQLEADLANSRSLATADRAKLVELAEAQQKLGADYAAGVQKYEAKIREIEAALATRGEAVRGLQAELSAAEERMAGLLQRLEAEVAGERERAEAAERLRTAEGEVNVGLRIQLQEGEQQRRILADQTENLRENLQQDQLGLEMLRAELEQQKSICLEEQTFAEEKFKKYEVNIACLRESVKQLEAERSNHQFQLRQLNAALKTSLDHIRSLRSVLSSVPSLPPLDESSLLSLLNLDHLTTRPQLTSLKNCLADLRQDVRTLTGELNSRASTPLRCLSVSPLTISEDCPAPAPAPNPALANRGHPISPSSTCSSPSVTPTFPASMASPASTPPATPPPPAHPALLPHVLVSPSKSVVPPLPSSTSPLRVGAAANT